jgi:hypothetical protein
MNYELAKELKNAGFPQGGKGGWAFPPDALVGRSKDRVYVPSLSELIEACGDGFYQMQRGITNWRCIGIKTKTFVGNTPEEAVARLWLALNTKV